jgi:hypothetical protein
VWHFQLIELGIPWGWKKRRDREEDRGGKQSNHPKGLESVGWRVCRIAAQEGARQEKVGNRDQEQEGACLSSLLSRVANDRQKQQSAECDKGK